MSGDVIAGADHAVDPRIDTGEGGEATPVTDHVNDIAGPIDIEVEDDNA